MHKQSIRRGLALAVCLGLVATLGLSALLVFTHAHQNCVHGNPCATCVQMHDAQGLLRQLLALAALLFLMSLLLTHGRMLRQRAVSTGNLFTPITQKVRMNN